ncbi:hypothetical protein RAA17_18565 [Komagataeibacter rhaeticus]|nr:hypothetical protein [Komagataeibacter rhaeticus]
MTQGRDVPACDFTQGALVAAQSPFAAQRSVVAVLGDARCAVRHGARPA